MGASQRDIAKLECLNRTTVARKLIFLASQARLNFEIKNLEKPKSKIIEFDDLETIEHTKMKPVSVTAAVEYKTRRILGFEVSQMPAKGLIAKKSVKKYGFRQDLRFRGRSALFERLKHLVEPNALIKSDSHPHYTLTVQEFFPQATHHQILGVRGATQGQGELKKIGFDPLFSLNHTFAMNRARINRLFRKTWCTTKKMERLADHIAIYSDFHNEYLDQIAAKKNSV